MTALERIALERAAEQLQAGAWKASEEGGRRQRKETSTACAVCHAEFQRRSHNVMLCPDCNAKGRRTEPCKGCGGPTLRNDVQGVHNKERRGFCKACRLGMPQAQRGRETIAHARAVLEARMKGQEAVLRSLKSTPEGGR